MSRKQIWKASCASLALLGMLENSVAFAAEPVLTNATSTTSPGYALQTTVGNETPLGTAEKIALLRKRVKYVFVLFQENRSFDHYFGTYPGANGLYSTFPGAVTSVPANQTVSFTQNIALPATNFLPAADQLNGGAAGYGTVTPFLAPRQIQDVNGNTVSLYPESIYSVDHSHTGYIADLHPDQATVSQTKNDGYALDQEGLEYATDASSTGSIVTSSSVFPPNTTAPTSSRTLQQYQKGLVVMAHVDCDTIPFLWHWADIGTLFDNLHQTTIGPSTPNAIAMIAAQGGATQWALHPATTGTHTAAYTVPNETDSAPFAGSAADTYAGKPPYGPDEAGFGTCAVTLKDGGGVATGLYNNLACPSPASNDPAIADFTASAPVALKAALTAYASPQLNLTFASLPLSFMGNQIGPILAQDQHKATDLVDIQHDIVTISAKNPNVPWGWYQQGFGPEPFDGQKVVDTFPVGTPHASYIVHHNGPQYFGYLGDNPAELANMHSLQQFYTDVNGGALPGNGGVFYVRGGYYNNDNLQSADPNPGVRATFSGNDDHGSYSDSQISEAMVADSVNAIANSKYWSQSAIIITYDESDGFYDHAPEAIRSWDPYGLPMSGGPRIPTIVLSPYSAAHTVSHAYSEHGSIVKFINELFGLVPLSALPDERHAQALAAAATPTNGEASTLNPKGLPQTALAPNDGSGVGDLLEAFDNDKLIHDTNLLPAGAVTIPQNVVTTLPHYGNANGAGCAAVGITPTDYSNGTLQDPPPAYFNPRPTVSYGLPYYGLTVYSDNSTAAGWGN